MGKEKVCLARQQLFFGHFLNAQQDIAVGQILFYFHACRQILSIRIAAVGGCLGDDFYVSSIFLYPLTLRRRQGYPVVGRYFSFMQ